MREIFDYILSLLKSRILPLVLVFVVLVTILINRLFSLQIINGESYKASLTDSVKKDMSVAATRGRIYDRNGVLLAYNDLAFAVKISDSGKYSDSNGRKAIDIKNETINNWHRCLCGIAMQLSRKHGETGAARGSRIYREILPYPRAELYPNRQRGV